MSDINITVEDREGNVAELVAPTDMGLSLMEFLKASEYDVLAPAEVWLYVLLVV